MDNLLKALTDVITAQAEYDKALDDCSGTWGYYGAHEIERVNKAREHFNTLLNKVITDKVKEVLDAIQ